MNSRTLSARRSLAVALALAGLATLLWGARVLQVVHEEVTQVNWLREHATASSYRVVELGVYDGGHLDAVWVEVPGQPQAFVDLSRSAEQVHDVGDRILARVDEREAPALGRGLPEDVVTASQGGRYVGPGAVLVVGVLLVAGAVVLARSAERPPRHRGRIPKRVDA